MNRKLLLCALLGIACLYTYRLERIEERTWPAAGIATLSAGSRNGAITVTAVDDSLVRGLITRYCYGRDSADAERVLANVTVTDTIVGSVLKVVAQMPAGSRPYGAKFEFTAPDSVLPTLSTTNGSVTVTNMSAGANVTTSNGAVNLTGTAGAADVSTTNGAVTVTVHRGAVVAATTNGKVECDLAELGPTESCLLSTTNGAVTLWLPSDVSASFDLKTTNGDVTVTGFGAVTYDVSERAHKQGRIGSGASTVTVETSNAGITVRSRQ